MIKSLNRKTELRLVRWALHVALAAVLFGCIMMVQSTWLSRLAGEKMEARKEATWIRERMKQTSKITKEHTAMATLMAALQDRATSIRNRIPDRPNEGQFLEQTTRAAKASGVQVKEYRRGKIEFDGDHSQLQVHISLLGSFANICDYIDRLENLPRISRISQMRVKSEKQTDMYPVDLTLTLFFRTDTPDERIARSLQ